MTPMVLFSGLLYQRSKIAGGLEWLAETSMVRTVLMNGRLAVYPF